MIIQKFDNCIAADPMKFSQRYQSAVWPICGTDSYFGKFVCRYFLVADTIAHEMSHLWCGDLVSMAWWNDLWLNEASATL